MANRWGKCGNSVSFCFLLLHFQYSDCSHEVKRCLLLWKITMTNLDSVLKSRDITLLTKLYLVKAMAFLIVMCGCESWTIKKAEHQRNDAFKLWCCRWHLIVPWTSRRSNQLILKEINTILIGRTDTEAEAPILWPPVVKSWLIGKYPDAGKDWNLEEKRVTENEMVGSHRWLKGL